jgi:hypothetical protein
MDTILRGNTFNVNGNRMTSQNNQRVYLDDLCKRWQKSADQILEMAINGKVALWIAFSNVYLQKTGKANGGKKKKAIAPQLYDLAEVKPQTEVLALIQSRSDRMLVGAEFSCLDANNKAIMVSNSVGEEWGETSMIGLKPNTLFALLEEVVRYERKHKIDMAPIDFQAPGYRAPLQYEKPSANMKDHPCFSRELHIAGNCWDALFAHTGTEAPEIKKTDIRAWLQQYYPELSRAAMERIALIVTPVKSGRR